MIALRLTIGCVLAFGGIGAAVAMDGNIQDSSSTRTGASLDAPARDGGGSGGDAIGFNRDCGQRCTAPENATPNDSQPAEPATSGNTGHAPLRRASLGWQSLLPGSIQ